MRRAWKVEHGRGRTSEAGRIGVVGVVIIVGCLGMGAAAWGQTAKDDSAKAPAEVEVTSARVRAAVERALPLLQKSLIVYAEKRDCFSCHNQAVPMVALRIARSRGLKIDEEAFAMGATLTQADLENALEHYRDGEGQPGGIIRAAYALWALEVADHPHDEITDAVTHYLVSVDSKRDHWGTSAQRVPIEASHFTATALALRGLRAFAAEDEHPEDRQKRVEAARDWLVKAKAKDTEDRVFRLWGLSLAGATDEEIHAARDELLATQREDGGWSQIDELASDAYATGSVLVALQEAGGLATDDPAYRRGLAFLIGSQKEDGTWYVSSRSKPFQPYFESGFPYEKDQFISVAASGWAAAALGLALPPDGE